MKSHVLHTVYTSNYKYSGEDRVDITAKGDHPVWRYFAPTWAMVNGIHGNTLSWENYTEMYFDILRSAPGGVWDELLKMQTATFVCFCSKNSYCHRNIMVNYMHEIIGARITVGGYHT